MPSPRWMMLSRLANAFRVATRAGGPSMGQRLRALPRMVRAVVRGEYAGSSVGRILLMVGALGWIISPVDLLPEALLGVFGLIDDAMIASWLVSTVVLETENYLAWEKSTVAPSAAGRTGAAGDTGTAAGAAGATTWNAGGPTPASVRSSVVR